MLVSSSFPPLLSIILETSFSVEMSKDLSRALICLTVTGSVSTLIFCLIFSGSSVKTSLLSLLSIKCCFNTKCSSWWLLHPSYSIYPILPGFGSQYLTPYSLKKGKRSGRIILINGNNSLGLAKAGVPVSKIILLHCLRSGERNWVLFDFSFFK